LPLYSAIAREALAERLGLLRPQCPLLAQSGHAELHCTRPLLGVSRTLFKEVPAVQALWQFSDQKKRAGVDSGVDKSKVLLKVPAGQRLLSVKLTSGFPSLRNRRGDPCRSGYRASRYSLHLGFIGKRSGGCSETRTSPSPYSADFLNGTKFGTGLSDIAGISIGDIRQRECA
jgi:hypothetical protein